jgi:pimeloyl-ACP methyl ester carboxylesterase
MERKLPAAIACALIAAFPDMRLRAETAVSIDYSFADRPAQLPATFAAPPGANLRFITLRAIDGERIDGALWQPASKTAAGTTLVIGVPGSGGNFARAPLGPLSSALSVKGYGMLAINTRQHDERVNTDNFLDVRRDIEAAIYTARALGYRKLVLFGHSLGNIQVQYYAANNWDPDIKAVVLAGMFANLPRKARPTTVADEDAFRRQSDAAFKALRNGKGDELLPLPMRRTGKPVTAQHFLTYRYEASSTADGTYWIKRVPRPILMVRDAGDTVIQPFEPDMLLSAATSAGSLVPNIKYVLLPDAKGPNPGGHLFLDTVQALADATAAWLGEQGL